MQKICVALLYKSHAINLLKDFGWVRMMHKGISYAYAVFHRINKFMLFLSHTHSMAYFIEKPQTFGAHQRYASFYDIKETR